MYYMRSLTLTVEKIILLQRKEKTQFGVEYWDMRGGLWYMQNVEAVTTRKYKSIESIQADTIPLYSKPPQNARVIVPIYL